MKVAEQDFDQLLREHCALLREHGRVQARCGEQLSAQAREIDRLRAQAFRQRAQLIQRDTALAWAREDRAALEQAIPGLPGRVKLARHVNVLVARIQELLRERLRWEWHKARPMVAEADAAIPPVDDREGLEATLRTADLVICQTGCLSHGAYWRVQDLCRRTGKACVLVEQPDALRIVRIHRAPDDADRAPAATAAPAPASHA